MDRLAEIKARLAAATPGPWRVETTDLFGVYEMPHEDVMRGRSPKDSDQENEANAEVFSHAPDDLGWLVAEVERLRETVEDALVLGGFSVGPRAYVYRRACDALGVRVGEPAYEEALSRARARMGTGTVAEEGQDGR